MSAVKTPVTSLEILNAKSGVQSCCLPLLRAHYIGAHLGPTSLAVHSLYNLMAGMHCHAEMGTGTIQLTQIPQVFSNHYSLFQRAFTVCSLQSEQPSLYYQQNFYWKEFLQLGSKIFYSAAFSYHLSRSLPLGMLRIRLF